MNAVLATTVLLGGAAAHTLQMNVHYPQSSLKGDGLTLRGSGLGLDWDKGVDMEQASRDLWTANVTFSGASASLEFKPLVDDDTWAQGANFAVELSGADATVDVYPYFYASEGRIETVKNVCSKTLGNCRDLQMYLPPSFDENTLKSYDNVLVMHDGENLFDPSTSFGGVAWMCQDTVNGLLNEGAMEEIVIVGVDNTMNRIDEYTYSVDPEYGGGNGDAYLDFLEQTVLPEVTDTYRLDVSGPDNLGIMGSSLGGLISCYAGWTRSDVWGKAGCMSSSFWWNSEDFNSTIIPSADPVGALMVYLDSGDAGDSADGVLGTRTIKKDMLASGFTEDEDLFYYLDNGASHSEYYWGRRFWIPMTELYAVQPLSLS